MYERFERLLKAKGITAYKVSQATGITTATLSEWKQGTYTPKQDKIQKIADYLGVSVDYLMGFEKKDKTDMFQTLINTFGSKALYVVAKYCRYERINRELTENSISTICNIDLQRYLSFEEKYENIGVANIINILSFYNTDIKFMCGFITGALMDFETDEQIIDTLQSLMRNDK